MRGRVSLSVTVPVRHHCYLPFSWIDRYVGFKYIKQFCILVALFIWVVSIVTSFFILRENHGLNETKRKYVLLRKECCKHKETMGFVNYIDHTIDK